MVAARATLLSGFLGAGKTTLVNHVLATATGERIAVLVNDFGGVNVDAALVASRQEDTLELTNGCVCCSIRDDLVGSVQAVLRRPDPPSRLLVEMSGVADPGAVGRTFRLLETAWPINLDGVIAVVDAEGFPPPGTPHHALAREQLAVADLVVVNKADLVDPPTLETRLRELRAYHPTARLLPAVQGSVPVSVLLGLDAADAPERLDAPAPGAPAAHGDDFESWVLDVPGPLALPRLRRVVTALPPAVLRLKGFVEVAELPDHRALVQVVARRGRLDRADPWAAGPRSGTLVAVVSRRDVRPGDQEALHRDLAGCRATVGERAHGLARRLTDWLRRGDTSTPKNRPAG